MLSLLVARLLASCLRTSIALSIVFSELATSSSIDSQRQEEAWEEATLLLLELILHPRSDSGSTSANSLGNRFFHIWTIIHQISLKRRTSLSRRFGLVPTLGVFK